MPYDYILKRENIAWGGYSVDEKGVPLNSINDEPYLGSVHTNTLGYEAWFKNGYLHRDNDLPALVRFSEAYIASNGDYYVDLEGNSKKIPLDYSFSYWYKMGKLHRDGDLPAFIHFGKTRRTLNQGYYVDFEGNRKKIPLSHSFSYWYKNGELHRGGDLPALIGEAGRHEWHICGVPHRVNGPQVMHLPKNAKYKFANFVNNVLSYLPEDTRISRDKNVNEFKLFGIKVNASEHAQILVHSKTFNCPLWVSLFLVLNIINQETLEFILGSEELLDNSLPMNWVIKLLDLEDVNIEDKLQGRYFENEDEDEDEDDHINIMKLMDDIIKVTEFMNHENMKITVN